MPTTIKLSLAALIVAIAALFAPLSAAPLLRTLYVTVTDKDGAKVPDLTTHRASTRWWPRSTSSR